MPRVVIRGTTPHLTLTLDGVPVQGCTGFRLVANSPDDIPVLQLDIDATDLDVDAQADLGNPHPGDLLPPGVRSNESLERINAELIRRNQRDRARIRELERQVTELNRNQPPRPSAEYPGPTRAGRIQPGIDFTPRQHLTVPPQAVRTEPVSHPRRRRRVNQRWRQRFNELHETFVGTYPPGYTFSDQVIEESVRVPLRAEMAAGGDPDEGRVFPDGPATAPEYRGSSGEAVREDTGNDRLVDAQPAAPEPVEPGGIQAGSILGVDPARPDSDRSVLTVDNIAAAADDLHRIATGIGRAPAIPARARAVASRATINGLHRQALQDFIGGCRRRCRDRLVVLFVERAEWSPRTNRVEWEGQYDERAHRDLRDQPTHLILITPDDFAQYIVNESIELGTVDSEQPVRLRGGGALIERFQSGNGPSGFTVEESQFVPEGTVMFYDPTQIGGAQIPSPAQVRDNFFGLSQVDEHMGRWAGPETARLPDYETDEEGNPI